MQFRAIDFDRDAEPIASIMAEFDSEPLEPAEVMSRWRDNDLAVNPLRMVCEIDGEVVGYLNCRRWTFLPDGRCLIDVGVKSSFSRRGIGTKLMQLGFEHAELAGWTSLASRGRETGDMAAEIFLKKLGFQFNYLHYESVMALGSNQIDFEDLLAEKRSEFEIKNWSEIGDTEENRKRLYDLMIDCDKSEPGAAEFGTMSYEAFLMESFAKSGFSAEGLFIAFAGDEWAGMHQVSENKNGVTDARVEYTGVRDEFRGRGLAKALKWLGVVYCRNQGWKSLMTHNDSRNAPMLAVNDQFGYERLPGWKHFVRTLN